LGLYLDDEKSSIYQPNHLPIPHVVPADLPFGRGPSSGLKLLGAPIGNLELCSGVSERTVSKVSQAHHLLTERDDPKLSPSYYGPVRDAGKWHTSTVSYRLILSCVGSCAAEATEQNV
jgi:hypothetical protein